VKSNAEVTDCAWLPVAVTRGVATVLHIPSNWSRATQARGPPRATTQENFSCT